jgi:hypothetical protein
MVWWLLLQIPRTFIWLESQQGLMATGYTYPEYDDIQGQNYAGKLYNFVLLTWFVN